MLLHTFQLSAIQPCTEPWKCSRTSRAFCLDEGAQIYTSVKRPQYWKHKRDPPSYFMKDILNTVHRREAKLVANTIQLYWKESKILWLCRNQKWDQGYWLKGQKSHLPSCLLSAMVGLYCFPLNKTAELVLKECCCTQGVTSSWLSAATKMLTFWNGRYSLQPLWLRPFHMETIKRQKAYHNKGMRRKIRKYKQIGSFSKSGYSIYC